ncbi:MAG: hypothetical protein ACI9U2_003851 [Bradymonadia bacterium]|jgi:hypothetical protein
MDIAVYDDVNANGRVDAGELRGRLVDRFDGHEGYGPAWFPGYEAILTRHLEIDHAEPYTMAFRPFIWTYATSDLPNITYYDPRQVTFPDEVSVRASSTVTCATAYPACIPSVTGFQAPDLHMLADDLSDAALARIQRAYLYSDDALELHPLLGEIGDCYADDEFLWVVYNFARARQTGECECQVSRQTVYAYIEPSNVPDWVECAGGRVRIEGDAVVDAPTDTAQSFE